MVSETNYASSKVTRQNRTVSPGPSLILKEKPIPKTISFNLQGGIRCDRVHRHLTRHTTIGIDEETLMNHKIYDSIDSSQRL